MEKKLIIFILITFLSTIGNSQYIFFNDNFDDGNLTSNPSWNLTPGGVGCWSPGTREVINGAYHVIDMRQDGCGHGTEIDMNVDIPVTSSTFISFDVKAVYKSIWGAGVVDEEYPCSIMLYLYNNQNQLLKLRFCYNYDGGSNLFTPDYIRIANPSIPQNVWFPDGHFIKTYFPDAVSLKRIFVGSNGWRYEAFFDNIKILSNLLPPPILPGGVFLGNHWTSGYSSDPVNTSTGNLIHEENDIRINCRGLNIEFTRYYNSLDTALGPLGLGWSHSYYVYLNENATENWVSVKWADGRCDFWEKDGSSNYSPMHPGNYNKLIKEIDGTWKVINKRLDIYSFSTIGILESISDKNDNILQLSYDNSFYPELVTGVTDASGRTLSLEYNVSGFLILITDYISTPRTVSYLVSNNKLMNIIDLMGNEINYTYNNEQLLTAITDQRGILTVTNVYDEFGRVIQQQDGNGNITIFEFDTPSINKTKITLSGLSDTHTHSDIYNLLLSIENPLGDAINFNYNPNNERISIMNRNGDEVQYIYNSGGNVISVQDPPPDGGFTYTKYEDLQFPDFPTKYTDAEGGVTEWTYDNQGNVLIETRESKTKTYTYNNFGQRTSLTDECGNTHQYIYDTDGLLTHETDAEGNSTWYSYDELWRRTSVTDGRGSGPGDPNFTTTYIYDDADRLIQIIGPSPASITKSYEYDEVGNKISETDGNGNETLYTYDNNNNLIAETDNIGTKSYTYDEWNRNISIMDENNHTTNYSYDNAGRLVTKEDAEGNTWSYTYDAQGNKLTETDPSGVTLTYEYNSLNLQTTIKDELLNEKTFEYDKLSRLVYKTDALDNPTSYSYDSFGRLLSVTEAGGGVTQYTYDNCGNLTQINDANNNVISTREYDNLKRLIKKYDGLGNHYEYGYDEVGNMIWMKDANLQTTNYLYDSENRLTHVNYPDGSKVTYTYDSNGNVLSMDDSTGTSHYTYDSRNRLLSSTDGFGKQVQYSFDNVGNRTSLTYPDSKQVSYTYDGANKLISLLDWSNNKISYYYNGFQIDSVAYPNGLVEKATYDAAGRLTSKTTGINLFGMSWTRDGEGNPLTLTETGLLSVTIPNENSFYQYDNDNRLIETSEGSYTYDNNGNLITRNISGGSVNFSYNSRNLMVAQVSTTNSIQNIYDGNNNRVARIENGNERRYVLDQSGSMSNILCETNATGTITAYYIFGLGLLTKIEDDGTRHYYHTNNIGSVAAITDENGQVTDKYLYSPFGTVLDREGTTSNEFTFVGAFGVMTEGDGLYFMRERFYDPRTGRFLSKDPIGSSILNPMNLQKYHYSYNNPLVYIDPDGDFAILPAMAVGAILEGSAELGSYLVFDVSLAGNQFDLSTATSKFIGGGVGGALRVATTAFAPAISSTVAGGAKEITTYAVDKILKGENVDFNEVFYRGIYGVAKGYIFGQLFQKQWDFKSNGSKLQTYCKGCGRFTNGDQFMKTYLNGLINRKIKGFLLDRIFSYENITGIFNSKNVPFIEKNNSPLHSIRAKYVSNY